MILRHSKTWRGLRQHLAQNRLLIIASLTLFSIVSITRLLGGFQGLELITLDYMMRLRPHEPIDRRIVIVGVTAADIERQRRYPLSDAQLTQLLQKVIRYHPRVIGLDIFRDTLIPPGSEAFQAILAEHPEIMVIEKAFPGLGGTSIPAPKDVRPEQIGFADAVLDSDGALRRSLLGATPESKDFSYSLTFRLAEQYLKSEGMVLSPGHIDPFAMRFGQTELPRFQSNTGGYHQAHASGVQLLLNYRNSPMPFRQVSWHELEQEKVNPAWFHDQIVLIGITDLVQQDVLNAPAVLQSETGIPGQVYGVEIQAHAVSQIISAVMDDRPLFFTGSESWEYLWILVWSLIGISTSLGVKRSWQYGITFSFLGVSLLGISYGAILIGLWVPLMPALIGFLGNGIGVYAFSRYDQLLRDRIRDRQQVIDNTFHAIHNGPLQLLGSTLRTLQSKTTTLSQVNHELQHLNQDLRKIYQLVSQEAQRPNTPLFINPELHLDKDTPLHEMLYTIYDQTLKRDLGFNSIQIKIIKFEPLNTQSLTATDKRNLCRLLEELLCNVGKHGVGVTQLGVSCEQVGLQNRIQVSNNSSQALSSLALSSGQGTQFAHTLAQQLHGTFERSLDAHGGVICKLTWPIQPLPKWKFWA